jgi:hypothetical protein
MNRVVLDAELRAKLNGASAEVEFTDEAGNTVGHFLTDTEYKQLLYDIARHVVSKEEIAEARSEMLAKGGASTDEILQAIAAAKSEWEARR